MMNLSEKFTFTRRQIILMTLTVAGGCLVGCSKRRQMNSDSMEMLKLIEDAFLPPGGSIPQSAKSLKVHKDLIEFMKTQPEDVKKNFNRALRFVNYFPILELKFTTFQGMNDKQRKEYIQGWANSRLGIKRIIYQGLKSAITFAYFSHPEVWQYMGYDGPWV